MAQTRAGREYRQHARAYNSAFMMASTSARIDRRFTTGVHAFRISGVVSHLMGGLTPPDMTAAPRFAQLYIMDTDTQVGHRTAARNDLSAETLRALTLMIDGCNPLAQQFRRTALNDPGNVRDLSVVITQRDAPDRRRYNCPTVAEIAGITPDAIAALEPHRQIVVRLHGGGITRLDEFHVSYDALHFVLLFPHGEEGWRVGVPQSRPVAATPQRRRRECRHGPGIMRSLHRILSAGVQPGPVKRVMQISSVVRTDMSCHVRCVGVRVLSAAQHGDERPIHTVISDLRMWHHPTIDYV